MRWIGLAALVSVALYLLFRSGSAPLGIDYQDASCFQCAVDSDDTPAPYTVAVAVYSHCLNRGARDRIRSTWGAHARALGMSVVFYLGQSPACEVGVQQESTLFDDFVVLPVPEQYSLLPRKTLSLLAYAAAGSGNVAAAAPVGGPGSSEQASADADILLKLDDDVYLDAARFLQRVSRLPRQAVLVSGVYGGFFHNRSAVVTEPGRKWADPTYPLPTYPPYAAGLAYYLSRPLLQWLREGARRQVLHTGWANEDASVGSWLLGTTALRVHEEAALRCLDCHAASFDVAPWAIHVQSIAQDAVEAEALKDSVDTAAAAGAGSSGSDSEQQHWQGDADGQGPPDAEGGAGGAGGAANQRREAALARHWGVIHDRVTSGGLLRGQCCTALH